VKIPHKEISYKYLSATNTITAQPEDWKPLQSKAIYGPNVHILHSLDYLFLHFPMQSAIKLNANFLEFLVH
jgi:hypothetical protein